MKKTTLCYIEKDDCYLMLYRNKKRIDENKNKWIGVGGKFLPGETPEACLLREVREETGLMLNSYSLRGIVTFISDEWENQDMYLYTADDFSGEMIDCDEGELKWIKKDEIIDLPLWEGDKIFLKLLKEDAKYFNLKLVYEGDTLVSSEIK